MKSWSFLLSLLIIFSVIGGCITREAPQPVTTPPAVTEAPPTAEPIEAIPEIEEIAEEELIEEPAFVENETIDLGSIL